MGAIADSIEQKLMVAMKSGDSEATSVLRLIKSAVANERIAKMADLSAEDEIAVLRREVKKRDDAIELYTKAGESARAEAEQKEAAFIKEFLPPEMSEDDVRSAVKQALATQSISGKENFGKAMSAAMAELKGRASGDIVSRLVREELS